MSANELSERKEIKLTLSIDHINNNNIHVFLLHSKGK